MGRGGILPKDGRLPCPVEEGIHSLGVDHTHPATANGELPHRAGGTTTDRTIPAADASFPFLPFLPSLLPSTVPFPLATHAATRDRSPRASLPSRSWPWHGRRNDGERRQGGGGPLRPLPCPRATLPPAKALLLLRPPTILPAGSASPGHLSGRHLALGVGGEWRGSNH
jgi:hypothetical protein